MNKINLTLLFVFVFILSFVSVNAINVDWDKLEKGAPVEVTEESEVTGCDQESTICFPTDTIPPKFEARGNIKCKCTEDKCPKTGDEFVCKDDNAGCLCYYAEAEGKCHKDTTACEGPARIKEGGDFKPCKCGDAVTTKEKQYCFKDANFVGTEQECNLAEDCKDDCSSEGGGSCSGMTCGNGGRCDASETCILPGANLCEFIGAQCINLDHEFRTYDELCKEELEAGTGGGSGLGCTNLKYYHSLNGYLPYPGTTRGNTIRFPSTLELEKVDWDSPRIKNTPLEELGENPNSVNFEAMYLPSSGDLTGGQGSDFRMSLCGAPADSGGEDAIHKKACAVRETSACNDPNLLDGIFGTKQMDPLATAIWDKSGLKEGYSEWASDLTKTWNVGELGGDWGEAAQGWTSLVCKMKLRDKYAEDSTSKIDTRTDIKGELVLMINGQKSPVLPDNTILYEVSWMIFNVKGCKEEGCEPKAFNYSVYAFKAEDNEMGEKFHYAEKDGVKVNGNPCCTVDDGDTDYGYYAFYMNDTVDFELPCIKHSYDVDDPYCPQEFIPETYDGVYEENPQIEDGGAGGSDVSAGDPSNEV